MSDFKTAKNSFDFESILSLIDRTITPLYLSSTQEKVLREAWYGKTYSQIAHEHNYDSEYIKSVGCSLWQILSNAFNEQINKSNFVPFMRQKATEFVKSEKSLSSDSPVQTLSIDSANEQIFHWSTAPHTKDFLGRQEELMTLKSWTQESQCRCIIVSGMVGCGKTTLVTKLAEEVKDSFDCVIWISLYQTPSLKTLLENYLKLISKTCKDQIQLKSLELSFMITEFVEYLKQRKILLVLDGLQNILDTDQVNIIYKHKFEEYGQLLRAIITTNHRSLLITTSCIKPTMLEYYSENQVNFLNLSGFKLQTTKAFLNLKEKNLVNGQDALSLSENLQSNPRLLKIVINYMNNFLIEDSEDVWQDLSLLEGITKLLEQEFNYLSDFNQEIVYWLAISCFPLTLDHLWRSVERSQPKVKFLYSIDYLLKRSLIVKRDNTYILMPVMKNYLRRKLVAQALKRNAA